MKPVRWITLSVAVLAGGGVLWWFAIRPALQHSKARHDVDVLALALDGFLREQGEYPRGDLVTICRLLKGETIGDQNLRRLDYVEAQAYEVDTKGEFVDPWGTAYRIVLNPVVQVYSCGPNRIDERGNGDDISAGR